MARAPRDVLAFSEHWFRLVKACDNKQVVPIPYRDHSDYRSIINEFHSFRKALKNTPEFVDLYRKAAQIRTYRQDGVINFHNTEMGKMAHLLLDALGPDLEPAFVPPKEGDSIVPSEFVDNESDTVILMSKYFKEGGGKA